MASSERSSAWFERARRVMPGGVNSPVRGFGAVGGTPPFIVRGRGAVVEDADGRAYVDYVVSWGALILGHAHPDVVAEVADAAAGGTTFGAPTPWEVEFAERLCAALPAVDMIRLVNSGTEAAMSAVRLARGFTGRPRLVKFAGCYHGHADSLLAAAGSGVLTFGIPGTPGVTEGAARDTLVLPYNDLDAVAAAFRRHGDEIAAVIVEPVAGNMGLVPPQPGFLEGLRELTRRHGALLIFDEVITGFRVGPAGAQGRFGIEPDLTCLGKIIGGGLPLAAYGGRREIMERVAPAGPVYQAGTLSGNPVAVRAGLATLRLLAADPPYERLDAAARRLADGLGRILSEAGIPHAIQRLGSMFTVFFGTGGPVRNLDEAQRSNTELYAAFFHAMLEQGVYLPPSQFEAAFLTAAHGDEEIDRTLAAAERAVERLREVAARWR